VLVRGHKVLGEGGGPKKRKEAPHQPPPREKKIEDFHERNRRRQIHRGKERERKGGWRRCNKKIGV